MTERTLPRPATTDEFHIVRSRFLDSFADTERSVVAVHRRLGLKDGKLTFGQRLEALAKIKAGPTFSKANVALVIGRIERLTILNALRVDIVHSHMNIAAIAGETRAMFINAKNCEDEFPVARLLTLDQFRQLAKELKDISSALARIALNQASSKPQPSPGAAAGP